MDNKIRRCACWVLCVGLATAAGGGCSDDDESKGYLGAVMDALTQAEVTAAKVNMRTLARELGAYESDHGAFPITLDDLVKAQGLSDKAIRSIGKTPRPFSYIQGQTMKSPPENVLVYDENPIYDRQCLLLRVSGEVELLGPADLREALAQTKARLAGPGQKRPSDPDAGNVGGVWDPGDFE